MTNMDALILHAVKTRGRSHGLAIARELEEIKAKMISVGALYKAIRRLERDGMLLGEWEDDDGAHQGGRRRYYEITGAGEKALNEQRAELRRIGRVLRVGKDFA